MKKVFLILFIIFLLGIPLNEMWKFFSLTAAMVLIFSGSWRPKINFLSCLIILGLGIGLKFVPHLHIEEGHQILINDQNNIINPLGLIKEQRIPHAFSADGIWKNPKYSRIVNDIEFEGLNGLRLGTVNDLKYNLYPPHSTYIRENLPFLVAYVFPKEAVGSKIWFRGLCFWPNTSGELKKINHSSWEYRKIGIQDVGQPIYFVGGDTLKAKDYIQPLKVYLEKSTYYKILRWVSSLGTIFLIFCLIYVLLESKDKLKFYLYFSSISIQFFLLIFTKPVFFKGLFPLISGWDGLTYYSYGREILRNFWVGNFYEAIKSPESIFYFMPGLRYIRALELSIFGDTYYGYTLFWMFTPILMFKFLKYFFSKHQPIILLMIFFIPINFLTRYLGFSDYFYLNQTLFGHGETLSYLCFSTGILLIFQGMDQKKQTFWGHFLFFIAIACRPNLILAALFLMGIYTLWILKHDGYIQAAKKLICSWLGALPTLLIPFHNYYFGGKLVLLTNAAEIKENLPTPPSMYFGALMSLFSLDIKNPAFGKIWRQLCEWNPYAIRLPLIGLVIYYAFKLPLFSRIGTIARMALILHIQLFFFNTNIRYAYISWFLTFIVFLDAIFKSNAFKKSKEILGQILIDYVKKYWAKFS